MCVACFCSSALIWLHSRLGASWPSVRRASCKAESPLKEAQEAGFVLTHKRPLAKASSGFSERRRMLLQARSCFTTTQSNDLRFQHSSQVAHSCLDDRAGHHVKSCDF